MLGGKGLLKLFFQQVCEERAQMSLKDDIWNGKQRTVNNSHHIHKLKLQSNGVSSCLVTENYLTSLPSSFSFFLLLSDGMIYFFCTMNRESSEIIHYLIAMHLVYLLIFCIDGLFFFFNQNFLHVFVQPSTTLCGYRL